MANLRRTEGKKTERDYLILFTDSRTHKGFFYSFCLFSFSLFFSRRRVNSSSSLPSMQWRSREGSSSPRSVVFATDFQHSSFSSSFFFKPHPQQLCAEGLSPPHLHYTYAHSKILKERHPPPQKRTRNPIRLCSKRCVGVSPSFFSDSRSVEGLSSIVLPIEQPSVSPFFSSSSLLTAKYVFWWGRIWF